MAALGVGIIGCGNISAAYLRLAPLFRDIRIVAVSDLNPAAASARAAEFGVRAESVAALLQAPDVDIVLNLTIPAAHAEISRQALLANKHVYTEKPFALSLDEGLALCELAAERGLRLGAAPDTFLGGANQSARAALDRGALGRVIGGTAHVLSRGMEAWHPNPGFFFQPGGGPILDLGPYYVTNLVQLLGPVRAVTAMAAASFGTRTIGTGPLTGQTIPVDTPTNIHALMEFRSGALVTLGASWDVWAHGHPPIELHGEAATMTLPDPNFFGGAVMVAGPKGRERLDGGHPFGISNEGAGATATANYRGVGLAEMAQAILAGRPHRAGPELALHVVEVLTAILQSAERREWVECTTRCDRPAALDAVAAWGLLA